MATGLQLVTRALRTIKVLKVGGLPTVAESNLGLTVLNAMLDSWRNERLMVYAFQDEQITMASGQSAYTIGPTGDLVTTRPVDIEQEMYITASNTDIQVTKINKTRYKSIFDKTSQASYPEFAYFEGTYPDATLNVWPVPNAVNILHITTRVPLTAQTLAGTLAMPPGYEDSIVHNLAVRLSTEYVGSKLSKITVDLARTTKGDIKRTNSNRIQSGTELSALLGKSTQNILTGV